MVHICCCCVLYYHIIKTPFTRYWIHLNPICFHTVLAVLIHKDDDEYGMISIRL